MTGGRNGNQESLNTTEIFKAGLWTPGPELLYSLYNHCQVQVGGQVIIAGGRLGSDAVGRSWVMEGETWKEVGGMTKGRQFHACAELSGKVYSIGGETANSELLSSVEVYDPVTGRWTPGPELPVGMKYAQAVTFQNMIYLLAGEINGGIANLQMFTLTADGSDWQSGAGVEERFRTVFPAQVVTHNLINC